MNKFEKLTEFGSYLPKIRARLARDLRSKPDLSRRRVLAAVVQVMERTHIRVGNDIYARTNDSYGLTTIRNKHAHVFGKNVEFCFVGKSGVKRESSFQDGRLSRIIKQCQELPGQELFAFKDDDGRVHDINSHDVNEYLGEITKRHITAKDFRTWAGTVHAIETLLDLEPVERPSKTAFKKREVVAVKSAAAELGNTVSVCRKYYIHPAVFEADRAGKLEAIYRSASQRKTRGLNASEKTLMALLGV